MSILRAGTPTPAGVRRASGSTTPTTGGAGRATPMVQAPPSIGTHSVPTTQRGVPKGSPSELGRVLLAGREQPKYGNVELPSRTPTPASTSERLKGALFTAGSVVKQGAGIIGKNAALGTAAATGAYFTAVAGVETYGAASHDPRVATSFNPAILTGGYAAALAGLAVGGSIGLLEGAYTATKAVYERLKAPAPESIEEHDGEDVEAGEPSSLPYSTDIQGARLPVSAAADTGDVEASADSALARADDVDATLSAPTPARASGADVSTPATTSKSLRERLTPNNFSRASAGLGAVFGLGFGLSSVAMRMAPDAPPAGTPAHYVPSAMPLPPPVFIPVPPTNG